MKIFTYGVDLRYAEALRRKFGNGEYIDVTTCYQDILALCADIVIINTDSAAIEVVSIIKKFEDDTKDVDDTKYFYINNEDLEQWFIQQGAFGKQVIDGKKVRI